MSVTTEGLDVASAIDQLRAEQAEYVAIGNSMIFSRLGMTPEEMNRLTGRKFSFLLRGGSTPAAWYLTLKNVVAASGVHPKLVFFFFRDTELTELVSSVGIAHSQHATPPSATQGASASASREGFMGAVDLVSGWLSGPKGFYNFSTRPDGMQRRVTNLAMKTGGGKFSKIWNREVLTDRFSLDHLRSDVPADMAKADAGTDESPDAYQSTGTSYVAPEDSHLLPPLMQVAREHGLKLLFFRVKRRPEADSGMVSEPRQMKAYEQRLQQWIEQQGGLFYDESYDPAILLEAYNDGDHIGEEHRDWYRRYFWKRMSGVFP